VDAIIEITRKRMGMTAVLDANDALTGIFTDGDLRRLLEQGRDLRDLSIEAAMTRAPATIDPLALAAEAVHVMEERRITQLLVVDADARLVGALNVHDLLAAKVV